MEEYTNIITKQFRGNGFMTIAKYNNKGDIIYIADKESKVITAVETLSYGIIGTFNSHNGVIWSLDISSNDNYLISCSGDLSVIFWNTLNGDKIFQIYEKCIPKNVNTQKNLKTNYVSILCESLSKKSTSYINIYNLDDIENSEFKEFSKIEWAKELSKPTVLLWFNETKIIVGSESGKIYIRDIENLDYIEEYTFHNDSIKSIVFNKTKTQILTGSLDSTSKQINLENWTVLKTYTSTVPINYACFNHNDRKVLLGGGIEAMNVAKTTNNDLNLKIYRTSDQKLTNHIPSHFGPIRYIDKAPNSKNFMTASQDGTVKIYFINETENNKTDNNGNDKNEESIIENKKYELFGYAVEIDPENLLLSEEINKMENLSWIPKKIIEKPQVKTIPGMAIPVKSNSTNNLKNINSPISKSNSINNLKNINSPINKSNSINNLIDYKDTELFEIKSFVSTDIFNKAVEEVEATDDYVNTTVRVTNLPNDIQLKELWDMFDIFGRIEEKGIKIKSYQDTTMAFIKYAFIEGAQKAIKAVDGTALNYKIIHVEMSIPLK